jgi:hypothetical protein
MTAISQGKTKPTNAEASSAGNTNTSARTSQCSSRRGGHGTGSPFWCGNGDEVGQCSRATVRGLGALARLRGATRPAQINSAAASAPKPAVRLTTEGADKDRPARVADLPPGRNMGAR